MSITDVPLRPSVWTMNTDGTSAIESNKHWFLHLWSHGRMGGNHGNTTNLVKHQSCNGGTKHDEVRRRSEEEGHGGAAGGETKTDLINHRVLRHRQTPSRYRWWTSPLVAIVSVTVQEKWSMCVWGALCAPRIRRLDSFVFIKSHGNSGESEPFCLACLSRAAAWWICCGKECILQTYSFLIAALEEDFPLTSTLSWPPTCPSDVSPSSLPPQASLQIRPLSPSLVLQTVMHGCLCFPKVH